MTAVTMSMSRSYIRFIVQTTGVIVTTAPSTTPMITIAIIAGTAIMGIDTTADITAMVLISPLTTSGITIARGTTAGSTIIIGINIATMITAAISHRFAINSTGKIGHNSALNQSRSSKVIR